MMPHVYRDDMGDILLESWDCAILWRLSTNEALHVQAALKSLLAAPVEESESLVDA